MLNDKLLINENSHLRIEKATILEIMDFIIGKVQEEKIQEINLLDKLRT